MTEKKLEIPEVYFSKTNKRTEIDIIDLSELQNRTQHLKPLPDSPHKVAFNMLVFIEQGQGAHLIDFERFHFKPNSILFLNKGQVQAFDFNKKLNGKAILYTEYFMNVLKENMRIPFHLPANLSTPHITLTGELKRSVLRLIEELNIEMDRTDTNNPIIMALFSALHLKLVRERKSPNNHLNNSDAQKFMNFLTLVEKLFTRSRDASFYANKLGMTYKSLNLLCKRASGKTAKYHIDHQVILEAKRMLTIEKGSISKLSYHLGFNEPTNFTKYFKRHTNISPKNF